MSTQELSHLSPEMERFNYERSLAAELYVFRNRLTYVAIGHLQLFLNRLDLASEEGCRRVGRLVHLIRGAELTLEVIVRPLLSVADRRSREEWQVAIELAHSYWESCNDLISVLRKAQKEATPEIRDDCSHCLARLEDCRHHAGEIHGELVRKFVEVRP